MRSYRQSVLALGMLLSACIVVNANEILRSWAPVRAMAETESILMTRDLDGPGRCNLVSIESQTFVALCNFRGYGTVTFREELDLSPCTAATPAIKPTRYLKISTDITGLCPDSEYTLSLHRYNCVNCNCKNAGPLLNLNKGIVRTDLRTTRDDGCLIIPEFKEEDFSIVPTDKSKFSILGGSCVLSENRKNTKKSAKSSKKSKCRACPSILCSPITVQTAVQLPQEFPSALKIGQK